MNYIVKLETLIKNLEKSQRVNSCDSNDEKESVRLAHAIIDMSESFKVILETLEPKLSSSNVTEEEIEDTLFDIGEELRHIIYHIKDPKFYEYLTPLI